MESAHNLSYSPLSSGLSAVSGSGDERELGAADDIAELERKAREALAAVQAQLGALSVYETHPDSQGVEGGRWIGGYYRRLVRLGDRPVPKMLQASAFGASWLLTGFAAAPLAALLLLTAEPGDRTSNPALPSMAGRVSESPASMVIAYLAPGTRPQAALPQADLSALVKAVATPADRPRLTVASLAAGNLPARVIEPARLSAKESLRARVAASPVLVSSIAGAVGRADLTDPPRLAGRVAAEAILPARLQAIGSARAGPAASAAAMRSTAAAPDQSPLRLAPSPGGTVAAQVVRPDHLKGIESSRAKALASPVLVSAAAASAARSELATAARSGHRNGVAAEPKPVTASTSQRSQPAVRSVQASVIAGLAPAAAPASAPPLPIFLASVGAEPDITDDTAGLRMPVTLAAHATRPQLLADQVTQGPQLLLTAGGRVVRVAAGLDPAQLGPGLYEAAIEWGGAQLPIAPLVVAGEPLEVALQIEPSTVTLHFDGAPDEQVLWTIRRSEGGTLRIRGPIVKQSLPPGDYAIEAELNGEIRRGTLKVAVGEALTLLMER